MRRDYKAALAVIVFLICYVPAETLWHRFRAWSRLYEQIWWNAEFVGTCSRIERELLDCEANHKGKVPVCYYCRCRRKSSLAEVRRQAVTYERRRLELLAIRNDPRAVLKWAEDNPPRRKPHGPWRPHPASVFVHRGNYLHDRRIEE